MVIDADGHFFESEEIFERYMEPGLRNYRPRLLSDEDGHNFWVVDGQTSYKRPYQFIAGRHISDGCVPCL
jgi:hypothetical protein